MTAGNDYEIIDVHFHLLRDISIEKAAGINPGRRDRDRIGFPEALLPYMARTGISRVVIVNYFPTGGVIGSALRKLPANLAKE